MKFIASSVLLVLCAGTWSCSGAAADGAEGLPGEELAAAEATPEKIIDRAALESEVEDVKVAEEQVAPVGAVHFVPAVGCEGVGGTWQSQVYSPEHAGYYEFTLHVHPAAHGASLAGDIVARSWMGAEADVSPPESCASDDHYHWTVVEPASGEVHPDGTIHFGGTAWSVGEHLCGTRVTDYSPNQFDFAPPAGETQIGSTLTGAISDAVVWVAPGMPAELTRISCD